MAKCRVSTTPALWHNAFFCAGFDTTAFRQGRISNDGNANPCEAFYKRKTTRFYIELGAKRMHELGYASARDFAEKKAELIYGRLPKVADAPRQIVKRR